MSERARGGEGQGGRRGDLGSFGTLLTWLVVLTALVAAADLVALSVRHAARAVLTAPLALGVLGVHAATAAAAALVALPMRALTRRPRIGRALGLLAALAAAVAGGALLLEWNAAFLARRGVGPAVTLIPALALWVLWLVVLGSPRPRLRVLAAVAGGLVAAALLAANTALFPATNRPQHASLLAFFWAFAVPALATLRRPRPSAPIGASLLALLLGIAAAGSMRADVGSSALRVAIRELAPNAAAALFAVGPLADPDGDGFPSGFGGGDCDPFSASVSPGAAEIPDDGVDNNCLGGDATAEAIADLRGRLSGPDTLGPPARSILLLTIDALRHDAPLPAVAARLGDRCQRFEGHATNSRTTFSMFSLFTSRFPSEARLTTRGAYWVPAEDDSPSLGSALIAAGYTTGAAAFNHIFDARYGIARGFQEIWIAGTDQAVVEGIAGPQTADMAIAWLDERPEPFLLWVHMYDPHEPYLPHPGGPPPSAPPRALYDAEVAFSDHHAARVLDALGERLPQVAVIVTGDHGEAFGEHGTYFHNTSVYQEEIHVPLWVCPPAGTPAPAARGAASLLDVAPTILDLAGVPRPWSFRGRSLLAPAPGPVPIFAETVRIDTAMQSVRVGRWKLVRFVTANALMLFDLAEDPEESRDRFDDEPEIAAQLTAVLDAWRGLVDREGAHPSEASEGEAEAD